MHPDATAESTPGRLAVVTDDGETRTYAEMTANAWRVAHLFRSVGLRPGDHVVLCMDTGPEMLEVLWGAHNAGLLYTACSARSTPAELAYVIRDSGASALVVSGGVAVLASAVVDDTPGVAHRFSVGGPVDGHRELERAVVDHSDRPLPGAVAGAPLLYSSGTTGRPKGVRPATTHPPLHEPEFYTEVTRRALDFRPGDVYLSPAPLHHAAPLRGCMSFHRLGGTVVLMRRFDAATALRLIERHRVTHAQFVPTMFLRMLRLDDAVRTASDHTSLRSVLHGSAPCPPEVKRRMIGWWGPIIDEYYGATEGLGATFVTSREWLERPGTVGRATVGTIHVVGPDGQELPAGETGTIWFSAGPSFSYHGDAAKTAQARTAAGWATVGDVGRLDADGYLYLADRQAHVILVGGVNVYPREAEDVLVTHPLVLDAAVFGVPDPERGEQVKAVVQPVEPPGDAAAAGQLERILIAHCRERLAGLKCPRSIDFRAELPRHETGKLHKYVLAAEYRAGTASG